MNASRVSRDPTAVRRIAAIDTTSFVLTFVYRDAQFSFSSVRALFSLVARRPDAPIVPIVPYVVADLARARDDSSRGFARRDARYLRETGRRSGIADIRADDEWGSLYRELKALEARGEGAEAGMLRALRLEKASILRVKARDGGTMCTLHRAFEFEESPSAAASLSALCQRSSEARARTATTATLARTPTQGRSGRRRT